MGTLPSSWASAPVKRHYEIQLGKMLQAIPSSDQDELVPYLKAVHVNWGSVSTENLPEMWASRTDTAQYGVSDGDLLVSEGGEVGRAGIVSKPPEGCIIQNALHRVRPRTHASERYLLYALRAVSSAGWFDVLCNRATIAHFTREKFAELRFPFPSLGTQLAIAAFLDRETARIDSIIQLKQRQIELLEEKRVALITQAVTKGLDPNVKMKDSGVEWLGEIPEHWGVQAVWTLFQLGRGRVISHQDIDDNPGPYPVYSSQTENDGVMGLLGTFDFEGDYLTWTTDGAKAGTVFHRRGRFNCTNVCGTLKAKQHKPVELGYMVHALNTATSWFVRHDINPKLMNDVMARISVPVPPHAEQREIAAILGDGTMQTSELLLSIRRSIGLLHEYSSSLITAAVTGQIDVRGEVSAPC
jgi:type I restriction enzyme S subunit